MIVENTWYKNKDCVSEEKNQSADIHSQLLAHLRVYYLIITSNIGDQQLSLAWVCESIEERSRKIAVLGKQNQWVCFWSKLQLVTIRIWAKFCQSVFTWCSPKWIQYITWCDEAVWSSGIYAGDGVIYRGQWSWQGHSLSSLWQQIFREVRRADM